MNKVYIELLQETQPGGQIVTYAIDNLCDLIVMGSRGLGALRGILGSVSSYVPVSYTHLDVYKRQPWACCWA